ASARRAQGLFQTDYFRVYTNPDVAGVELGGALKNVIAIAAGVVDGLGYGHNTRAALITRGLAEMTRLGVALGADPLTFAGLAGMGDLILTCTGALSRNHSVGEELGKGRPIDEILAGMTMVAEGVRTSRAARALAARAGIEMPIVEEVYAVLYEGRSPREALENLMLREPKPEQWSQWERRKEGGTAESVEVVAGSRRGCDADGRSTRLARSARCSTSSRTCSATGRLNFRSSRPPRTG